MGRQTWGLYFNFSTHTQISYFGSSAEVSVILTSPQALHPPAQVLFQVIHLLAPWLPLPPHWSLCFYSCPTNGLFCTQHRHNLLKWNQNMSVCCLKPLPWLPTALRNTNLFLPLHLPPQLGMLFLEDLAQRAAFQVGCGLNITPPERPSLTTLSKAVISAA